MNMEISIDVEAAKLLKTTVSGENHGWTPLFLPVYELGFEQFGSAPAGARGGHARRGLPGMGTGSRPVSTTHPMVLPAKVGSMEPHTCPWALGQRTTLQLWAIPRR